MRTFGDYHPLPVAFSLLAAAGVGMFSMDPAVLFLSLLGALLYFFILNGAREGKMHLFALVIFLAMALVNPLTYHNGVTVLFVMNGMPVTKEALFYGLSAGGMVIGVLYWFRCFSQVMTSDKLMYLMGRISPKLSLVISMALRYVPLFRQQHQKIRQSQMALGMYKEENIVDSFRGNLRIFSVMVTWALENGVITADSMAARGYGVGKRTHFSVFRFRARDGILLGLAAGLLLLSLFGLAGRSISYYPAIHYSPMTLRAAAGYMAYALLCLMPALTHGKEAIQWHFSGWKK